MTVDLRFYLKLFLRRLPYFFFVLAIGSAAGVTLAVMLPPVFRAEAVLIVESQQIPSDLAESTVQVQASEQLQIIQQRILTRASLIDMANRLNIYAAEIAEGKRRPADEIVDDMRSRIDISVPNAGEQGQATIVRVSFKAPNSQLSSQVTNEVVTMILNENAEIRTTVAGQTLVFFTQEVARLDQELTARGAQILQFQQENLQALPDSLDFRRSQQAAAQERLTQLGREEAMLNDRRSRLVTLYEQTGTTGQEPAAPRLTPDEQQLAALKADLDAALAVLSPTNPRVRVLQARLEALQAKIDAAEPEASAPDAVSPALSDYELQLADIDGQLDYNRQQQDALRAQLADLQATIEATPGNAITLGTMQRDYDNLRAQYDEAVSNRALAETGDTIEALAKGQRISIIEQAIPPREPESPNRLLLAGGGVAFGLFAGLAAVVLLELLKPGVRRPIEITNKLGITPLGTIPLIRTRWELFRRRLVILAGFGLALLGIPAALWYVHTNIVPLDQLVQRLLDPFT